MSLRECKCECVVLVLVVDDDDDEGSGLTFEAEEEEEEGWWRREGKDGRALNVFLLPYALEPVMASQLVIDRI